MRARGDSNSGASARFAGALTALLARWLGARPAQQLLAAVSPAIYFAAEMIVRGGLFWRIPIYWVLIPAMACAIGAWPFLGGRRDPIDTQPVATTHA